MLQSICRWSLQESHLDPELSREKLLSEDWITHRGCSGFLHVLRYNWYIYIDIHIYIYVYMNSSSHYASWLLLAWSAFYTTAQVGMRNGPRRTRHAAAAICNGHHAMLAAVTLLSATPETFFWRLRLFQGAFNQRIRRFIKSLPLRSPDCQSPSWSGLVDTGHTPPRWRAFL